MIKILLKIWSRIFFFSKENKYDRLWALPYWSNWNRKQKDFRGWPVFDPDLIAMHGARFEEFANYINKLTVARGYNINKLNNENQDDFKAVVCGRVSGFSGDRTIVMSLDTFLSSQDSLKIAYKSSAEEVTQPTNVPIVCDGNSDAMLVTDDTVKR